MERKPRFVKTLMPFLTRDEEEDRGLAHQFTQRVFEGYEIIDSTDLLTIVDSRSQSHVGEGNLNFRNMAGSSKRPQPLVEKSVLGQDSTKWVGPNQAHIISNDILEKPTSERWDFNLAK